MSFKIGDKVRLNPAIVTKEFLNDCYFDTSIPRILGATKERKIFTIKELKREHLRSSETRYYDCAVLYDENGKRLGWLPFKALAPLSSNFCPALTPGRILKLRGNYTYVVMNSEKAFEVHPLGGKESLSNWNTFTGKHGSRRDFDIIAMYNADNICGFRGIATATPIWTENIPAREMTVAEIEKELGHGIKVVGEDGTEWEF